MVTHPHHPRGFMRRAVTVVAALAMGAAFAAPAVALDDAGIQPGEAVPVTGQYKIYPGVQHVDYGDGAVIVGDAATTVVEPDVDSDTKARLKEVLDLKCVTAQESGAVPDGASGLNVLVGINGSGGVVDAYASQLVESGELNIDADTFEKTDAYVLSVLPGTPDRADTVMVLGRDTDAAFYGLTTLYQIFQQVSGNKLTALTVSDWADVKSRGFIEGYYGSPWSTQDRVNLMTWGGYYKMNTYVYAPKDDPLHRNDWRTSYTQEQVDNEIRPQAEAGNRSKVRFVYAIAPFHDSDAARGKQFRFDTEEHYQEDLRVLKGRYQHVIDAGVRQIALLADDSTDWGRVYGNEQTYVRLTQDLTDWLHELQQKRNEDGTPMYEGLKDTLLYCPALYSYTGGGESWYDKFPSNVQIVMTGRRTFGSATPEFAEEFKGNTGRAPFMWVNWPCSDMNRNTAYQYLVMGGQNNFLKPGAESGAFDGIMLNPMQQSEPSKVGIFLAADYSWKLWQTEDEGQQAWEDSFSYVEHNSPVSTAGSRALRDLSMNMRILNDGGIDGRHDDVDYDATNKWWINQESVDYTGRNDVRGTLDKLKTKLDAGAATVADLSSAKRIYSQLAAAAKTYRADHGDQNLFEQVEPWISFWDDITEAALDYIASIQSSLTGDEAAAQDTATKGQEALTRSDTHTIADYYQKNKPAQGGLVVVRPTVLSLKSYANTLLQGDTPAPAPSEATLTASDVHAAYWNAHVDPEAVTDGDDTTFFWMQSDSGDCVDAGATVTVTYTVPFRSDIIRFVQAASNLDAIVNGTVEYQTADGSWVKAGDINADTPTEDVPGLTGNDRAVISTFTLPSAVTVKAVRVTNTTKTNKWWKLYDLSAVESATPGPVDKTELNDAITAAEAIDVSGWTDDTRAVFDAALKTARDYAKDDASVTGAQVETAVAALKAAMNGTVRYAGMTLDQLEADRIANDDGTYTVTSYAAYDAAYQRFVVALEYYAGDLTEQEGADLAAAYDAAKAALEKTDNSTPTPPVQLDTTKLDEAIARAEETDLNLYTDESAAKVRETLDAARALVEDGAQTTQAEIDQAAEALNAAVDALVEKPVDPDTPDQPDQPDMPDQPDTPDTSDPSTKPGKSDTGGKLSATGSSVTPIVVAAVLVLAAGVVLATRRRA